MSSLKFEHVKQQHPGLAPLLDSLGAYIAGQILRGAQYIVPKLAAAALGINDGEAFVLLEMLAKEEILHRVYNVYCRKENALLTTVDRIEDLNEVAQCDYCNIEHDPSDLKVEVAFAPSSGDLRNLAA